MKLDAGHKHLWTSVTSQDARDQEWTDSIEQGQQHDLDPPQLVEQKQLVMNQTYPSSHTLSSGIGSLSIPIALKDT